MMIPGLALVLVALALGCTLASLANPQRVPLWVGQLMLCIAMLAMLLGGR